MSDKDHLPFMAMGDFKSILNASKVKQEKMTAIYEIHVVTPMIGGGARPQQVDLNNPFRSSSVRGHLRFWWRATRGAEYKSSAELWKRESEIFGDTSSSSSIKIWVKPSGIPVSKANMARNIASLSTGPKYRLIPSLSSMSYVLWPFESDHTEVAASYSVALHIRYNVPTELREEYETEINAALWAWINFGGIGSRTRRGCGSLYCKDFSPESNREIHHWFNQCLKDYKINLGVPSEREWPTLGGEIHVQSSKKDIKLAWKDVIATYRTFRRRHNKRYRKLQHGEREGRSEWPEADSIRRLTNMGEPPHRISCTIEKGTAFPRAQFGLPITFQFKHDKDKEGKGSLDKEPPKTKLLLKLDNRLVDRLASPLILKTLAVTNKDGFGIIVHLNQPPIAGLQLLVQQEKNKKADENIKRKVDNFKIDKGQVYPELSYRSSPLNMPNGEKTSSAIEAFLASEEVRRWKAKTYPKNT